MPHVSACQLVVGITARELFCLTAATGGPPRTWRSTTVRGDRLWCMSTAAGPRSSYAALDSLRLHYLDWGTPAALTLVLLHALGALVTAHDWDGFAAAMQDTHRVIAPDQRGFGLSDWMPAYSFELMAQDLAQLVE